jgi:hypothetical protein
MTPKLNFNASIAFRSLISKGLENIDEAKWDIIPTGFKNNIRWQVAHLITSPGNLTYGIVGKDHPLVSKAFVEATRKGTSPESMTASGEDYSKKRLLTLFPQIITQLEKDWNYIKILPFKNYTTSTGLVLENLDAALAYSNVHDGIHLGNILAQMKLVG